ncbi:META domain-containing protein [Endozoicomonas sp. Mp262]|uniref:META domain-containing protein n=1 Tax=Endozoicomonas sp. Mp262 TaxID=2919499 RepID=UPI0021DA50B3
MNGTLPEGRWQEVTPSIGDTPMSFQVKDDRISAYAGCNQMMATMEMDGDRLVIGHLASTLMACYGQDRKREEALQNLLGGNPHVKYEGDDTLILSKGDQEYRFNKLPSLEASKK